MLLCFSLLKARPRVLRSRPHVLSSSQRWRGPNVTYNYLVRRHARVELRPNFLGPERISSSAELALRFYFLVRVENLVDLGAR